MIFIPWREFSDTILAGNMKQLCAFGLAAQWRAAMLNRRRWIMRENLLPGEKFPDIELVNENDEPTKLSSLMRGFPTAVVFSRGYY